MQPFLTLLQLQRTRQKLTLQEVAAALGLKSHSYVADIFTGKRPLPLEMVDQWADVLKFEGDDRFELYRAAINDLAPPWFALVVKRTENDLIETEGKLKKLEDHIIQEALRKSAPDSAR